MRVCTFVTGTTSSELQFHDVSVVPRNPLLIALPREDMLQTEAAVRIQTQARRKQAADRVAALKAELAREEAEERERQQQAALDETPVARVGTLAMANRRYGDASVHAVLSLRMDAKAPQGRS